MNWIGRIVMTIHFLLLEVQSLLSNAWRHARWPLLFYVLAILVVLSGIGWGVMIVVTGTIHDSDWTILGGGLMVLVGIVLLGVLLFPIAAAVNFFRRRSLTAQTTVQQTTTTVATPVATSTGAH